MLMLKYSLLLRTVGGFRAGSKRHEAKLRIVNSAELGQARRCLKSFGVCVYVCMCVSFISC